MSQKKTSNLLAVLISDIHYNINTLELADKALNLAIDKAYALKIPLIIAGDTHDTKANIRGECSNALVTTFQRAYDLGVKIYLIIGNHCLINEKSTEHSLNFLAPYCFIVDKEFFVSKPLSCIPYLSQPEMIHEILPQIPLSSIIIMHQGVKGSNAGDYIQDKTAIDASVFKNRRVISGHYHTRQDIELENGLFSYIGNPYTLTYGEAEDPEKGFQLLYDDGTLEFIPTNLRKHVKVKLENDNITSSVPLNKINKNDLVKLTVVLRKQDILKFNKKDLIAKYSLPENTTVDFDIIPDTDNKVQVKSLNKEDLLDKVIDNYNADDDIKQDLKDLWRNLCS